MQTHTKTLVKALSLALSLGLLTSAFAQHPHAKITAAKAAKAALAKYHGRVVGKVNLENEDGKWQYSVNVRSGKKLREIMVDANTGKIASVEVTSKAEEEAEAREEKAKKH